MQGHLIHIGFPKCGSTFLQKWFNQHPDLYYAPGALGGFYNVYQISQEASKNTLESFKYFVTSDESLSMPKVLTGALPGDLKTDINSLRSVESTQQNVCKILNTLYPNGKILFITRGFKGMITSSYSQYIRIGGTVSLKDLTPLILSDIQKPTVEEETGGDLNYSFIINQYQEAFGEENIMVLPYELLRDDQFRFLYIIEEWLAIPHFEAKIGRINESLSPQELYWYPKISALVKKISPKLGKKLHRKVYHWYINKIFQGRLKLPVGVLNKLRPAPELIESEFYETLLDFYRRNNKYRCALKLRDNPLYAPYFSEYLLD